MRRAILIAAVLGAALAGAAGGAGAGQKKQPPPPRCEQGPMTERNWEQVGQDYIYFDYVLCPPGANSPDPLVRVWITTRGDGIAVEKWAEGRDGADLVSLFHGKKKAYTLYRDLNAVPVKVFKSERRADVPADMAALPFMMDGSSLIPLENLQPESAERVRKVFADADVLVRQAERKVQLYREAHRIGTLAAALDKPLKAQK